MKIANLEHVESVSISDVIVGGRGGHGGGGGYDFSRNKRLNININETVNVRKDLYVTSYVRGNSAVAEGDAEAYGPDSNAEAFSYTFTDPYSSAASATSISQS